VKTNFSYDDARLTMANATGLSYADLCQLIDLKRPSRRRWSRGQHCPLPSSSLGQSMTPEQRAAYRALL